MESTTLEINVISARDLPEINLVSKMVVYVVVVLTGNNNQKFRTNADLTGGINPNWNFPAKFVIDELGNQETLLFTVRCSRNLGDRDVGKVHVPVSELFRSAADQNSMRQVTYPVKSPSGKTLGVFNFEYKFGGKVVGGSTASFNVEKPAAGYPNQGIGYPPEGYPPPQPGAGFPPLPQYGGNRQSYLPHNAPPLDKRLYSYGYPHNYYPPPPPPPPHYGYYPPPPVVIKEEKNSGMGKILAAGAALLGGLVCGAVIGEMAADLGPPSHAGGKGRPSISVANSTVQSCSQSQNMLGPIG